MTAAPAERGAVNLLATLDDERFTQRAIHADLERLDRKGVRVERFHRTPEDILAWIDAEFGGTWSSEAAAGGICIARDAHGPIGFAAFDPKGLRFRWLQPWNAQPQVGIFGPFGVSKRARKTGVGPVLLAFALFSLRERGYRAALIPVVTGESLLAYYRRHASIEVIEPVRLAEPGRRWRTTVLASGSGSNFQAVVDAAREPSRALGLNVTALITNRSKALVLERAARAGVPARALVWDRSGERSLYDASVLQAVAETEPDLVLLLGWMHVLPAAFVERFTDALNIHPAFLPLDPARNDVTMPDGTIIPAFRGPRAVDDAFAAEVTWGGASVHRLGVAVDRGEVLARAPLQRLPDESQDAFTVRLHELEHRVLLTAIRRWTFERP